MNVRYYPILLALSFWEASVCEAQPYYYPVQPGYVVPGVPPAVALPQPRPGVPNSAGWNTGYSAVTSSSERPNLFGRGLGGSDTIRQSTTRVVPNNALGQPILGYRAYGEPNSAGWNTGYSIVTESYERPNPLGRALGGSETVTESTTKIVPNNALGEPIGNAWTGWP